MRLFICLLSFLATASGVVCQQAGNLSQMNTLVSVLSENPEYTALVDAISEIDALQKLGAPKKKIMAALNALVKQVAFMKNYSSDTDLDLVLAWCAACKRSSIAPSKNLSSSAAVYNGRSADDLALALSARPEYAELFELFVTVQVMITEQSPLKKIRPHVFKLIERIQFVQKYASDELLDEVVSWCYAQKGCSKRAMAGWKKALIGMAAAAVLVLSFVAIRRRHRHGAHPGHGGVHDAALAGPGHHLGHLGAIHPPLLAAFVGGGGGGAPVPAPGGGGAPGAGIVGGGGGASELPRATFTELGRFSEDSRRANCPICVELFKGGQQIVLHIPDGAAHNVHGVHQRCLFDYWRHTGRRNVCVTCSSGNNRLFLGQFRSYVYPASDAPVARPAPVQDLTSAERLRRGQAAMARTRAAQLAALEGAGEPVGPPARAGANLSSDLQAAVIEQITTPGRGNNECPICLDSLLDAGTVLVCTRCKKVVGHSGMPDCSIEMEKGCPLCRAQGEIVQWTPPERLALRPAATTGGGTAGATAGVGSGPAGVVGGAGSSGVSAGAGAGPAVLETVNGVQKLRVSKELSIGVAQAAGLLPEGFIAANTLVRFGQTVAYILTGQHYQVLPPNVVEGPIDEYKVSNSRVTAPPPGYTKVALFEAANGDQIFIYRKNASTS